MRTRGNDASCYDGHIGGESWRCRKGRLPSIRAEKGVRERVPWALGTSRESGHTCTFSLKKTEVW